MPRAPKRASTVGAYTSASRPPNSLRTAEVATTTSEPSGSPAAAPSISRSPAGNPCSCSSEHIAGSQATIALRLTCPATQAAACWRTAEALTAAGTPACLAWLSTSGSS